MHVSKLMAALLAAAALLSTTSQAHADAPGASETAASIGSMIVMLPFALVSMGSEQVGQSLSNLSEHTAWQVTDVNEQPGGKTDVGMKSEDGKFKLAMTVLTPAARTQRLAAGDRLDIDRVGKTGYTVRKGTATIGVLAQPGMAHSAPRT